MDSPLRFSIRPDPVRVRLPKSAIGYSPAGRSLGWAGSTRRAVGCAPRETDASSRVTKTGGSGSAPSAPTRTRPKRTCGSSIAEDQRRRGSGMNEGSLR